MNHTDRTDRQRPDPTADVPHLVRAVDRVGRRLLRLGIPMGPNQLITIRGRVSGQPRTAAVAVIEVNGRRWVIGAYGNVNWVRNLRAAGEATLGIKRRSQSVTATELPHPEATAFFQTILPGYVAALPRIARMWVPRQLLDDPDRAAHEYPVFELHSHPTPR